MASLSPIQEIEKYLVEAKQLSPETGTIVSELAYGFAQQVANDLNAKAEKENVQINDLAQTLKERGFPSISEKVMQKLHEIRVQEKNAIFEALREDSSVVSRNLHLEFARELLQSQEDSKKAKAEQEGAK